MIVIKIKLNNNISKRLKSVRDSISSITIAISYVFLEKSEKSSPTVLSDRIIVTEHINQYEATSPEGGGKLWRAKTLHLV